MKHFDAFKIKSISDSVWNMPCKFNNELFLITIKGLKKLTKFKEIQLSIFSIDEKTEIVNIKIENPTMRLHLADFQMQYTGANIFMNHGQKILKFDVRTNKFKEYVLSQEKFESKFPPSVRIKSSHVYEDTIILHQLQSMTESFIGSYNLENEKFNWKIKDIEETIYDIQGIKDVVCVHIGNTIKCINKQTGEEIWEYTVDDSFIKKYEHSLGCTIDSNLMVFENQLIIGIKNGYIVSLNIETGKVLWKQDLDVLHMNSLFVSVEDKKMYLFSDSKYFIIAMNGDIVLNYIVLKERANELELHGNNNLTITETQVVIQDIFSGTLLVLDKNSGELRWHHKIELEGSVPLGYNPVVSDDSIFIYNYKNRPQSGGILRQISFETEN